MSVSLAVAAKHAAHPAGFAPLPWTMPEDRDAFELTGVAMNFAVMAGAGKRTLAWHLKTSAA